MLYISSMIVLGDDNIKKKKFYCLQQVHLANILPQATHTLNSVKTTSIRPKKCFTYLGWSFWVVTISKKQVSKTLNFELPGVKNYISRLCTNPLGDPPPPPPPCCQYPNSVKNM